MFQYKVIQKKVYRYYPFGDNEMKQLNAFKRI